MTHCSFHLPYVQHVLGTYVVPDNYLSTSLPTVKMSMTHCSFHLPYVPHVLNRTWYRTITFPHLFPY
jgi:hypothetical protein